MFKLGKPSLNGPSIPWQTVSHNQRVHIRCKTATTKRDPVPSSGENDVSFQLAPTHCTAAFGNPISCIWRRTKGPSVSLDLIETHLIERKGTRWHGEFMERVQTS